MLEAGAKKHNLEAREEKRLVRRWIGEEGRIKARETEMLDVTERGGYRDGGAGKYREIPECSRSRDFISSPPYIHLLRCAPIVRLTVTSYRTFHLPFLPFSFHPPPSPSRAIFSNRGINYRHENTIAVPSLSSARSPLSDTSIAPITRAVPMESRFVPLTTEATLLLATNALRLYSKERSCCVSTFRTKPFDLGGLDEETDARLRSFWYKEGVVRG